MNEVNFEVSPNYKGKNPKTKEQLDAEREARVAKRAAKSEVKKSTGLYESKDKMVSHPDHYKAGELEVIDIINEVTKDMKGIFATDTGNALKYLCRWNKKGKAKQDLEKCIWYCTHLIEQLEKNKAVN